VSARLTADPVYENGEVAALYARDTRTHWDLHVAKTMPLLLLQSENSILQDSSQTNLQECK
jgi:hypothetical protein